MTWAAETHFEITLVEGKIPAAPELRTSDCGGKLVTLESCMHGKAIDTVKPGAH